LEELSGDEKLWVLARVRARGMRCEGCRGRSFEVGDALFLGFLFVGADQDEYVVALTCRNPRCPSPRTGINLHEHEFRDLVADRGR
jgi:hypothetical protein